MSGITLNSATGKWTLAATILASAMVFIDGTALNVILPSLQKGLNASGLDLFWVLNSYLLMLASLIIVGGSLGDKRGRVLVFKIGIALFSFASLLCGFSATIEQLILFRGLQGIGGALMIPGSLAILSATFQKKEKGLAIGTWSAVTTIVTISGPVLGGALADAGLWRFIFFINIPLGLIAILIAHFKVPESKESNPTHTLDLWGAFLLILSLASLTFGFLKAPEVGFKSPIVWINLLLGVVSLLVFLWVENRAKSPMVPLKVFRNRCFSGVNLLTFFLYAALGAMMLFLSLNLIQIQQYTQLQAGLTFLPFTLMMAIFARNVGKWADQYGVRLFLILGPFITGLGFLALTFIGQTQGASDYWYTYFPCILLFSFGMALTVVPLTTTVMSAVSDDFAGIASGINNSISRIAGTMINAVLGATAIWFFLHHLNGDLIHFAFSDVETQAILQEAINLGEAKAPQIIEGHQTQQINQLYKEAFIYTYKSVGYICASLAILASIVAYLTIPNKP